MVGLVSREKETVERLRRTSAAFRLKHDVGKAVRWSAPSEREADTEALRARLSADAVTSRMAAAGTRSVVELYDEWKAEEGALFEGQLAALDAAIQAMKPLVS